MPRVVTLLLSLSLVLASRSTARADDAPACSCDLTPAACDAGCACDSECTVDWTADECAQPGAGCIANAVDLDDAALEAAELAALPAREPADGWPVAAAEVRCADGARNLDGRCVADPARGADELSGGCATTGGRAGAALVVAIGAACLMRRRRALALAIAASCVCDVPGWDAAVSAGPPGAGASFVEVFAVELASGGAQHLLASQPVAGDAIGAPVAHFALARARAELPIVRVAAGCGDRLVTTPRADGELLGWAAATPRDATAELVELATPAGCFAYETDPEAVAARVAAGDVISARLGHVWPPGWSEPAVSFDDPPSDALATPALVACPAVDRRSALILMYASPGADESRRFLAGCPGEVVVGDKTERGPADAMNTAAAHAAGGRSGFVLASNGDKLRALLLRPNGVERTAAYLRGKLAAGYDYLVIDEITADPSWADGTLLNRRLRQLLGRLPPHTVIPYISIDLTMYPGGGDELRGRRLLLRAFRIRARTLALEVYLHTDDVIAGAAPTIFRRAADRVVAAVRGLPGVAGIDRTLITTIGTSMHARFAQYRYLDDPARDLAAITREVNALRHGDGRLRRQHGLGYYFVDRGDMQPRPGTYSYAALVQRMTAQALRFK